MLNLLINHNVNPFLKDDKGRNALNYAEFYE